MKKNQPGDAARVRKLADCYARKRKRRSLLLRADPSEKLPTSPKNSRTLPLGLPGKAKTRIPMEFWESGWLFKAIDDHVWRTITRKTAHPFPATLREKHLTHPGYVLREIGNYGVEICPLTTKRRSGPHIPAGTRLMFTDFLWDKDSYPVFRAAIASVKVV